MAIKDIVQNKALFLRFAGERVSEKFEVIQNTF